MKLPVTILTGVVAAVALLAPAPSFSIEVSKLRGTYRFVAEKSDNIDTAIETGIAPMNLVVRPFARSRLHKITTPYPRIDIDSTNDTVTIVADPRTPVRTTLDGKPIPWSREDGETFNVSGRWDGATFEQTFVSGTGRRVNRYSMSPDGNSLSMQVTITGGGLPGAVRYQVVYQRIGATEVVSRTR